MNTLVLKLYATFITSIKRGNYKGIFSNAKPIYMLSIIDYIDKCNVCDNILSYSDNELNNLYAYNMSLYKEQFNTPFIRPFFHMDTEPFYELIWHKRPDELTYSRTPSAKFLRENLSHAKLDDDLWVLLKEPDNREYLKNCIIETYLK